MDRFVSHFTNRLDAKGRVSIPASFRQVLARDGFEGLYVHPALDVAALDAGGTQLIASIDQILSRFSPFSAEWEALSTALNGTSEILKLDGEGRIQITESLKTHAGLGEQITFVGLGHKFQLWEPERFKAQLAASRLQLREVKTQLSQRGEPVA
jgi:MraZ protein